MDEQGEIRRSAPWPFDGDRFPDDLGAVVHTTILEGRRPALQVVHFETGEWGISDAIDWPDEDNLVATHLWHVIHIDGTIESLAALLPPGHQADRDNEDQPWTISAHEPGQPGAKLAWRIAAPLRWLAMRFSSGAIRRP